jgi:hypothetical protein
MGEEKKGFKKRITTEAAEVRRESGEFGGGLRSEPQERGS